MPKPTTHRTTDPDATPARRRWALDGWAYGAPPRPAWGRPVPVECKQRALSTHSAPMKPLLSVHLHESSGAQAPASRLGAAPVASSGRRRRRKRTCCWCPGSKRKCSQEAPVTRLQDHHNTQDHQVHAAHGVNRSSCSHWVSFDKMC